MPIRPRTKLAAAAACGLTLALIATVGCGTVRAGYETAPYKVVGNHGDVEIRKYESLTLVGTASSTPGTRDQNGSFMKLFRYIQGDNDTDQKIAMTTPVFSKRESADAPMKMYFVLPKEHKDDAPEPKASAVKLERQPATTVAAIRFSGRMNKKLYDTKVAALQEWLSQTQVAAKGEYWAAQYDPPWTPGPLRRNEILVPVNPDSLPTESVTSDQ